MTTGFSAAEADTAAAPGRDAARLRQNGSWSGRYRFADLDVAALGTRRWSPTRPPGRASPAKPIEVDRSRGPFPVRADGTRPVTGAEQPSSTTRSSIHLVSPPTWVQWHMDHGRAAISVVDRGVGIPAIRTADHLRKVRSGRGAAVDANIRGTGVGLSIAQQIVAAHGGEIRLESEPGRGSTFTLLLPGGELMSWRTPVRACRRRARPRAWRSRTI
mgnify:CR=1 FL=1